MVDETTNQGIPVPEGAADVIDTEYEIGQDNIDGSFGRFGFDIHNPVFAISAVAIVAFVFYTLALPEQASGVFSSMFAFTTKNFDWFLIGAADLVVLFALLLIVTPFGSVRLGGADATPDYSYIGWFARLCCTNRVRDSSRESSVVAGMHEQTYTPNLQNQELASLQ